MILELILTSFTITMEDNVGILPILQKIPVLSELNAADHAEVIKNITMQFFPQGYVIFNEGDAGDAVYIIKSGMVRIFHPVPEDEEADEVAMLADNDFFGEMALVSEKPRNASAMVMEDTEVFMLRKADFYQLISKNPDMASRISSEFIHRMKENLKKEEQ